MANRRLLFLGMKPSVFLPSLIWIAIVATGVARFHQYERAPGSQRPVPGLWPDASEIHLNENAFTVVMFAHPRCPCTISSLDEFKALRSCLPGRFEIRFWMPENADKNWTDAPLCQRAQGIPNISVNPDINGIEARRFSALTSGHVVVFRPDRSCAYSGGLTTGRGQSNAGLSGFRVCAILKEQGLGRSNPPVFGCPLFDANDVRQTGNEPCQK